MKWISTLNNLEIMLQWFFQVNFCKHWTWKRRTKTPMRTGSFKFGGLLGLQTSSWTCPSRAIRPNFNPFCHRSSWTALESRWNSHARNAWPIGLKPWSTGWGDRFSSEVKKVNLWQHWNLELQKFCRVRGSLFGKRCSSQSATATWVLWMSSALAQNWLGKRSWLICGRRKSPQLRWQKRSCIPKPSCKGMTFHMVRLFSLTPKLHIPFGTRHYRKLPVEKQRDLLTWMRCHRIFHLADVLVSSRVEKSGVLTTSHGLVSTLHPNQGRVRNLILSMLWQRWSVQSCAMHKVVMLGWQEVLIWKAHTGSAQYTLRPGSSRTSLSGIPTRWPWRFFASRHFLLEVWSLSTASFEFHIACGPF